jgi:hypothetical protein
MEECAPVRNQTSSSAKAPRRTALFSSRLSLSVFEELNFPKAFLCFFDCLVRASEVPALAGNNPIAAFHFLNHDVLPLVIFAQSNQM